MLLRTFVLLLLAAALGGCASPLRISLTPEQRASITELDARLVVVQDEVIVDVRPSTAGATGMAFGLIGALVSTTIDSAVTNSRVKATQNLMGSFYMAIDDLDVRQEFAEGIRPALDNFPIKVTSVTPALGISDKELRKWRDSLKPGQSLLVVVPRYLLSADFRALDAETWVTLWKKEGDDKPVNRGVLRYQSALTGPGGQESIAAWSANGAAGFRAAIKEAVAETVGLMRLDMDLAANPVKGDQQRDFAFYNGGQVTSVKGSPVRETAARVTVLGADGKLYSLPKAAPANN